MKRLVIAVALVLSALAATTSHAAAAGIPLLSRMHQTTTASSAPSNDYSFLAETCTGSESSAMCGIEYAHNSSTAAVGPPTGGVFACEQEFPSGYQEIILPFGDFQAYGTSNYVAGVAGVLSGSAIYSNLVGHANVIYGDGYSGPVSGTAIGVAKFSTAPSSLEAPPNYYVVSGGRIVITLRGTIYSYNYDTRASSTSQGSMTCSIAPSSTGQSLVVTPFS